MELQITVKRGKSAEFTLEKYARGLSDFKNAPSKYVFGNSEFLFAHDKSELLAYLSYLYTADEAEILMFEVKKKLRRCGIGSHLCERLFEILKNLKISSLFLEVSHGNLAACSLYKKLGFRQKGIRRNYYKETGEDALIMEKII
ncbi:MAG: ribosomal protein S18-alanine N-acetyltransferase [Fibrobacterota bacterium]